MCTPTRSAQPRASLISYHQYGVIAFPAPLSATRLSIFFLAAASAYTDNKQRYTTEPSSPAAANDANTEHKPKLQASGKRASPIDRVRPPIIIAVRQPALAQFDSVIARASITLPLRHSCVAIGCLVAMYFALAKSTGDTVTTAANPDGSPRTSAVPAPTVFLPDVEPSTSRGVGGTSANTAPSGSNPGSPSGSNTGAPSESNADAPSESNADAQSGSNADAPSGSNVDAPSGSNTDGRRTSPDKHRDSDSGVGEPQITLEDFDMSTDDESDGAGFSLSVGDYILNRNLNVSVLMVLT